MRPNQNNGTVIDHDRRGVRLSASARAAVCLAAGLLGLLILGATPSAAAPTTIGQLAPSPASATVGCPAGQSWDVLEPTVPSGSKYVVPKGDGAITSWSTRANSNSGQMLQLNVYRLVSGTTYEVVGHDGPHALTANKVNTFKTDLPVQPGDVIGLGSPSPSHETACAFKVASGSDLELEENILDYDSGTFTSYSGYRDNVTAVVGPAHTAIRKAGVYYSWVTTTNSTFTGSGLGLANLNGTGGGTLNEGGHTAAETIDAATGKVYWANYPSVFVTSCSSGPGGNQIKFANLNGSGVRVLKTTGATVDGPDGVAVDPAHGRIYWANELANKISYANLNGTGGKNLNTGTATVDCPAGITVDPALGKVFWANPVANKISFANLNGSGGGDLSTGSASVDAPVGVAIDPSNGKIYWANAFNSTISYANLNGSGAGNLSTGSANVDGPYGVAIDPTAGRIYWANNGSTSNTNAISWASLSGSGGGNLATPGAPATQAKFPVLLKSPSGAGAPHVASKAGGILACSPGSWALDLVAALLYRAPQTFSYRWTLNGKAIHGATKPLLHAKSAGKYVCRVTAKNYAGTATQASKPHKVSG